MINQFVSHCESVLDLENATLSDAYYYSSLPLCIIDSAFSIGVRYTSTSNVVKRYCNNYNLSMFRNKSLGYPDRELQHTTSQLIKNIEMNGVECFAKDILKNLQRTSSKSGILKAEAVYNWAKVFERHEIDTFQDITKVSRQVENEVMSIKGQKSGLSLTYFRMLSGNDELCKPDRHLLRFVSQAIKSEVKDISEAQSIICVAVNTLKKTYPNITVRLLDHTIWNYMSTKNTRSEMNI